MKPQEFLPIFNAAKPVERAGYTLTEFLAEGGEARVYEAVHRDGQQVAIKAFKESQSEEAVAAFKAEGQKLKELASDHIVAVHWLDSVSVTAGNRRAKSVLQYPYMAMELADGSVRDYIGSSQLTTERALAWTVQALQGMQHAHGEDAPADTASRVVHRDLKPENLLVVDGKVKVSDFGIAVAGHLTDMSISRTQLPKGTLPYMAPEQFQGRALLSSDIYSMGATSYVMVTGQRPIQCEGDYYAWAIAHRENQPELVPVLHPDGTPDRLAMAIQEVCIAAMAKRPKDRFTSMGAFQEALITAAGRTRSTAHPNTTFFDLKLTPDALAGSPDEADKTAAFRTHLLSSHADGVVGHRKPKPRVEASAEFDDGISPGRRKLLYGFVGLAVSVAIGEGTRRVVTGEWEESPAPESGPTKEDLLIRSAAKWVIETCKKEERIGDLFYLTRHLIPVDYVTAHGYIRAMPPALASFLAADLALYNPGGAEALMRSYEAANDYVSATRIALGLAYFGKEKKDETNGGKYTSGVPADPERRAAFDAAARVSKACGDKDLKELLSLAGRTEYERSDFGIKVDLAEQKLVELRESDRKDKHELVEMLCRIIARDNPTAVHESLAYYLEQTTKTTGEEQKTMLQMTRDLAIDLAAFYPAMALDAFDTLADSSDSDFQAAADAISLALIPQEPARVREYIEQDVYRHVNRHPLAVGVIQRLMVWNDARTFFTEPVLSWLKLVDEPTEAKVEKAKKALQGDTFEDYAYWLAAAALKGQTGFHE